MTTTATKKAQPKISELGVVGLFGWQHPTSGWKRLWKAFHVTKKGATEIVNGADVRGTAELVLLRQYPGITIKHVTVLWSDDAPLRSIDDFLKKKG